MPTLQPHLRPVFAPRFAQRAAQDADRRQRLDRCAHRQLNPGRSADTINRILRHKQQNGVALVVTLPSPSGKNVLEWVSDASGCSRQSSGGKHGRNTF